MGSGLLRAFAVLASGWTAMLAVAGAQSAAALELPPAAGCSATAAPTVLIVLSPRMVYALREWPRMRRAAERTGFAVCSLRDPRVDEPEWRAAAGAADRPEVLGLSLADTAATSASTIVALPNHSPASFVRLGDRLHPWPILGVMPDAAWIALLHDRLDRLREGR